MVLVDSRPAPAPWWVRSKAPWTGEIFSRMILRAEDPEEQRIQALREAMVPLYKEGKRRLSFTQAQIVTRSYQETEGMHPAIRRARGMDRVFREIPVALMPGQLLMGTASSGPNVVDFNPQFLRSALPNAERPGGMSPILGVEKLFVVEPEEIQQFEAEVWPYWRTRTRDVYYCRDMERNYPEEWRFIQVGGTFDPLFGGALHHTIQDYAAVLAKGMVGLKEEIQARMAELDAADPHTMDPFERRNQYRAMLIVADGMIAYANRNADLAEELAAQESDPQRAAELREMARICRKVPAHPAETWWEALQCFHFLRAGTALVEGGDAHSAGRFDQYMLPYLQRDLAAGGITRKQAQELLECFFIKWNETLLFGLGIHWGRGNNDKVNLGGMDSHGNDATNELSYMLLEAHAHVHLIDPSLSVRVHRGTPDDFLRQTLEVTRLGGGLPTLLSDEVSVPGLVSRAGVSLADARNYGDIGCQENATDPNMTGADVNGRTNAGFFSLPKSIELALHNGVNPLNGEQVGPRTGDPRTFSTMEQFLAAVKTQLEYGTRVYVLANNLSDYIFTSYYPCPFHNLMHPTTRKSGVDINNGGCKYNWTGAVGIGPGTAGDMLSAIDTLIYRHREATWDELLAALQNNWEGAEELRKKCLEAPKYGCDDEYADGWVRRHLAAWFDATEQYSTPRGGKWLCGMYSMASYITLGRWMGATPDGRRRGEHLSDSVAPSQLAPALGPTATHRSAARAIDAYHTVNGVTFNQRFNSTSITTARDVSKWMDLVRSYVDAGGQQVQYQIVDRKTLERARRHPEQYRDLIVRVGGYSAIFVYLSEELQESIMARVEQDV